MNRREKYTYQRLSKSGTFANPKGADIAYSFSNRELDDLFLDWVQEHFKRNATGDQASFLVWKGILEDVSDTKPDVEMKFGPRLGIARRIL